MSGEIIQYFMVYCLFMLFYKIFKPFYPVISGSINSLYSQIALFHGW